MRIAIDAMGSDRAPVPEIEGAVQILAEEDDIEIYLIGKRDVLERYLKKIKDKRMKIVEASGVIEMGEEPSKALKKRNSSIAKGIRLLKENKVKGFISAGNTGAIMAFALTVLGTIKGIKRPALGAVLPTPYDGNTLALDVGANVDAKPHHLLEYAKIGDVFAKKIFKKKNPRIGLLNVGTEPTKGNKLVREAYRLLQDSGLNFIGNIEGNDLLSYKTDVIISEGFSGNIMLKTGEGMVEIILSVLKHIMKEEKKYRFRKWISKPIIKDFLKRLHYEETGGAFLLGVNGNIVISHGRSSPRAIKNGIRQLIFAARENLHEAIGKAFSR